MSLVNLEPQPRGIQDWQVAEENAATWMRHWGFRDSQLTGAGSDGGVDVQSVGALAQVKMQGTPVGRPAIQNLVGARRLDHGKTLLFFSNAGYASTAIDEANRSNVALFQYDVATGGMTAVNGAARRLMATPHNGEGLPSSLRPALPGRSKWVPDEAVALGGDVAWFDYRAAPKDLGKGFQAIYEALGNGLEPDLDAADESVRINVQPNSGYVGLKAIIANWQPVVHEGQLVCRIHWTTYSEGTQSVAEQISTDAHRAAKRANQILADHLGGWLGHDNEAEFGGDRPPLDAETPTEWRDYRFGNDREDLLVDAVMQVWQRLGIQSAKPDMQWADNVNVCFTIPAGPVYKGLAAILIEMHLLSGPDGDLAAVRVRCSTDSTGATATAERVEDDADDAIARARVIIGEALGHPIQTGMDA